MRSNSGFKGARDKTIQHNGGSSTLNISNVYAEVAGKLYRSCGSGGGCTTSATHTVNISNVIAIGVNQVAGVSENDKVTLSNICTYRTAVLCNTYQVNSDNDSTKGAIVVHRVDVWRWSGYWKLAGMTPTTV